MASRGWLQQDPAVARGGVILAWLTMMYFGALFALPPRRYRGCGASDWRVVRLGVEPDVSLGIIGF